MDVFGNLLKLLNLPKRYISLNTFQIWIGHTLIVYFLEEKNYRLFSFYQI